MKKQATSVPTKASVKAVAPKTVAGVPLPTGRALRGASRVHTAIDEAGFAEVHGATDRKVFKLELPDGVDHAALAEVIRAGFAARLAPVGAKVKTKLRLPDYAEDEPVKPSTLQEALDLLKDQLTTTENLFGDLAVQLEPILEYPTDIGDDTKASASGVLAKSPLHFQINDTRERLVRLSQYIVATTKRVTV